MNLITSWRDSLKWWSNRIMLIGASLPIAWMFLPTDWRQVIVEWKDGALVLIASAIGLSAFIARNIKQKKLEDKVDEAIDSVKIS